MRVWALAWKGRGALLVLWSTSLPLEAPGPTGVCLERRQREADRRGRDTRSSTRQSKRDVASGYLLEMEAPRGKRFARA